MTVSWSSTGTVSNNQTTTVTPAYPATLAAGDLIGCFATSGETSATQPGNPTGSGWSSPFSVSGGAGAFGLDAGPRRATVWWKVSDGTETGTESITIGGSATNRMISAQMFRLTKTLTDWVVSITGGSDTSSGTGYSCAGSTSSVKNGGHIVALSAWTPDTATPTSPTVTWTGTGTAAVSGRSAVANTSGHDVRITIQSRDVTGDSSGTPTYACTLSAAGSGSTIMFSASDENSTISITPNDATHAHSAESPTVTQLHVVAPADATSAHSAESPAVTQLHLVQPADSTHGHSAESPTVAITHIVAPNDSTHGHSAESPTLTQTHVVAPADAAHGHTAEQPTVEVPAIEISPADALHAHTAESPTVSQVHAVEPDDSTHGHTAESPVVLVVIPAPVPASRISSPVARNQRTSARSINRTSGASSAALTATVRHAQRTSQAIPHSTTASA